MLYVLVQQLVQIHQIAHKYKQLLRHSENTIHQIPQKYRHYNFSEHNPSNTQQVPTTSQTLRRHDPSNTPTSCLYLWDIWWIVFWVSECRRSCMYLWAIWLIVSSCKQRNHIKDIHTRPYEIFFLLRFFFCKTKFSEKRNAWIYSVLRIRNWRRPMFPLILGS